MRMASQRRSSSSPKPRAPPSSPASSTASSRARPAAPPPWPPAMARSGPGPGRAVPHGPAPTGRAGGGSAIKQPRRETAQGRDAPHGPALTAPPPPPREPAPRSALSASVQSRTGQGTGPTCASAWHPGVPLRSWGSPDPHPKPEERTCAGSISPLRAGSLVLGDPLPAFPSETPGNTRPCLVSPQQVPPPVPCGQCPWETSSLPPELPPRV
ncbi:basic salivary proline-rich protein 1-like [Melozone crissalis]|uniref:basic salivary proline-rich protein 1-like n=1 Tax=Melozone crissalis TaxID=40204 RepID=UPI0023DA27CA|nr:basic salivary proline-rich protein 1-like [Melozone crissalis]